MWQVYLAALSLALVAALSGGCRAPTGSVSPKIRFDTTRLDADGLVGPVDGKRSVSYEFCIPDTTAARAEVQTIDPTARFMPGSPGRSGCARDQALVIGETHQANHLQVLNRLAALPYVTSIQESFFE